MGEIKTYRDLLVWQKSINLVTEIYKQTKQFPEIEIYGLTSQIRRAAISIPSNIAEGFGRYFTNDFIRFLQYASGSLYELQTQLDISKNLSYLVNGNYIELTNNTKEIERMISSLIARLKK